MLEREEVLLEQIQIQRKCIDEYEREIVKLPQPIKAVTSKSTETVNTQIIISSNKISKPTC